MSTPFKICSKNFAASLFILLTVLSVDNARAQLQITPEAKAEIEKQTEIKNDAIKARDKTKRDWDEAAIKKANTDLPTLAKEYEQKKNEVSALKDEYNSLEEDKISGELSSAKFDAHPTVKKVKDLRKRMKEISNERQVLTLNREVARQKVTDYKAKVKAEQLKIDQAEVLIKFLKEGKSPGEAERELADKVARLEQDLQKKEQDLQNEVIATSVLTATSNTETKRLKDQLAVANKQVKELEGKLARCNHQQGEPKRTTNVNTSNKTKTLPNTPVPKIGEMVPHSVPHDDTTAPSAQ